MMNSSFASGDTGSPSISPRHETVKSDKSEAGSSVSKDEDTLDIERDENITPQMIEDNEARLKARIAHCKNIIDSLKLQVTEEKAKLKIEREAELNQHLQHVSEYDSVQSMGSSMYTACVENKMYCDENLIEYEKQLQKYQNTLNMAQNEKKNAIRKQMMAKAFKLKLMEVENQCNIELLRVKQSLQCLEPLQVIASKWKNADDNVYDVNCYDLMPSFLELKAHSGSDLNGTYKEESSHSAKEDAALSD